MTTITNARIATTESNQAATYSKTRQWRNQIILAAPIMQLPGPSPPVTKKTGALQSRDSRLTLEGAADAYLANCFACKTTPEVKELAAQQQLSPSRLSRTFHRVVGIPLSKYFKHAQIERAKTLLRETPLSTTRVAYASGFGTRNTFFRIFRRRTGLTPGEFRRRRE